MWYYYTAGGNVERIVTNSAGTQQYAATRFQYAMNGRALTFAIGETWNWDGNSANCPTSYAIPWAREFRYDGARARYLNRQLDTTALLAGNFVPLANGDTWTDYDGDTAYGDYTVSGGAATNTRSYQPGIAVVDPFMSSGNTATDYFLTDHLGTTRGLTLPNGTPTDSVTFTAFGEKISGADHRFGYVGQFGYQSHDEMSFLHVGHRYYDPSSGRFLQRDPIGIVGGLNVYAYVSNKPTFRIDPNGLFDELGCQKACDAWLKAGGALLCTADVGIKDCYNSCSFGYWPPPSKGRGMPWPGLCPPCDTGVPSPGGGGPPNTPVPPPTGMPVNPPTVCGCTGIEAAPFLWLYWIWFRRKNAHGKSMTHA